MHLADNRMSAYLGICLQKKEDWCSHKNLSANACSRITQSGPNWKQPRSPGTGEWSAGRGVLCRRWTTDTQKAWAKLQNYSTWKQSTPKGDTLYGLIYRALLSWQQEAGGWEQWLQLQKAARRTVLKASVLHPMHLDADMLVMTLHSISTRWHHLV